jgi:hypothetical protein
VVGYIQRVLDRCRSSLLVLLLLTCSCSRLKQASECNRLVSTVNGALAEIAQLNQRGGRKAATYRSLAERYDNLAQRLSKEKYGTDALNGVAGEYSAYSRQIAAALRRAAPHVDGSSESAALKRERTTLEGLVRQEKTMIVKVETACRTP